MDKKLFELTYGNKLYSTELNNWWVITFVSYSINIVKNGSSINDMMALFFEVKFIDNFMNSKFIGIHEIGYGKKYLTEAQYKIKKRCSIINELM